MYQKYRLIHWQWQNIYIYIYIYKTQLLALSLRERQLLHAIVTFLRRLVARGRSCEPPAGAGSGWTELSLIWQSPESQGSPMAATHCERSSNVSPDKKRLQLRRQELNSDRMPLEEQAAEIFGI